MCSEGDVSATATSFQQLPPELIKHVASFLPTNEIACNLRLVSKSFAELFQHARTVHLSLTVPHAAFATKWLAPGACYDIPWHRRRQLVALTAASGDHTNLAAALRAAQLPLRGDVLAAAAAAGRVETCAWLLERFCRISLPWALREALNAAAKAGQRATCEWCLSNGAEWADTCAFAAARAGHPALAEWLISQRPPGAPGSVSRSIFLTSVARGCDLPTLQRLCSSWLSSTTNSPGAAPGNPAPGATGSSPSTRAGCLYSAAQSRTSDWEAKLEWLDGRGLCPALGPPCPRSLEVCRAAAGVRPDAEAQRRLAWLQRAGFPLSWRALAAAAGAGNVGTLRWLLQDQHVDPDTILTSWEAFSEGQLEAVQVLHAADCRIEPARSMRVAVGATAPGPFPDIARWLVETFGVDAVGLGPELSEEAARAGSLEVLDALAGWGCAFGPRAWVAAAVSGCEAALDWLSTQGCPMPDDGRPFLEAAWHGDLACLARLQRLGCPLGPNPHGLFTRAVFSRQGARRFANAASLDALRWLAGEGGCAVAWQAARDAAGNRAEGDREAVLEWLDRAQEEAEAGAREQVGAGQEAQAEG